MNPNDRGRLYQDRECVVRKGEEGSTMFVILRGQLEVIDERDGQEVSLNIMRQGDVFGEMALFQKEPRSVTVRALGEAQVMTIDKRALLKRIKEDPLVAMNLIETLCQRIRRLSAMVETRH